jgi:hypothetical protein
VHAIQDEQHGPALGSSIIRRDKHVALIVTPQAILPSRRKRQDGTLSEGELGRLGYPRVRGMDRLGVILKLWGECRRSLPVEFGVEGGIGDLEMSVCSLMQVSY